MSGLFSKGNNTTTTNTSPPPAVMQSYMDIMSRADATSRNPYTPYGGNLVAGFTPDQLAAFQGYRDSQGIAQPWITQAGIYGAEGAAPITPGQIAGYFNPFTQYATNAAIQNFSDLNAQQNQQVVSNAIKANAWGGDRAAVAQSELAKQQLLGEAPTLANMNVTGYNTALNAAQQDALRAGQAAYTFGQLGSETQNTTLAGLQALYGAGATQQQLAQAGLNVPYQQYLESRAYPFQTLSWLTGIDTGVGSQSGGTSSTTGPPPNLLASLLGIGAVGTGAYLGSQPRAAAAPAPTAARGGGINAGYRLHREDGGSAMPFSGGFIPTVPIRTGSGPPRPPQIPGQTGAGPMDMLKGLNAGSSLGKLFGGSGAGASGSAATAEGAGVAGSAGAAAEGAGLATEGAAAGEGAAAAGLGAEAMDLLPLLLLRRGGGIHVPHHLHAGGGGVGFDDAGRGFAGVYDSLPGEDLPSFFDPGMDKSDITYGGPAATGMPTNRIRYAGLGAPRDLPADLGAGTDVSYGPPPNATFADRFVEPPAPAPGLGTALNSHVVPGGLYASTGAPEVPFSTVPTPTPAGASVAPPVPAGGPVVTAGDYSPTPTYPPVAAAPPPPRPGLDVAMRRPAPDTANLFGFDVPRSLSAPLMAAGFGMLASRSPFLGQAIGEGGLAGVSMYQAQQEREIKHATEQQKIRAMSDRLKGILDHQSATAAETARHHQATESAGRYVDAGTYTAPDGTSRPAIRDTRSPKAGLLDAATGEKIDPNARVIPKGANALQPLTSEQLAAVGWTQKAIDAAADDYNLTKTQPTNLGRYGPQIKGAIMNRAIEKLEAQNKGPEDRARQWQDYKSQQLGVQRFTSGKQGDVVRSLNVSTDHLGTLRQMVDALHNGDIQGFNRIANWWAKQTGKAAPTNLETAASIVGTEVLKAIGGIGTGEERANIERRFGSVGNSPQQALGAIGAAQALMAGQIDGLRQQWKLATGRPKEMFDEMLLPTTREFLNVRHGGHEAPPTGSPTGGRTDLQPAPRATLDEARAAIAAGKDRGAVIQRLEQNGYSATGL